MTDLIGTDLRGRVLLAASLNPGIAVVGLDNLVGEMLHILLGDLIIESTTDETLGCKQSMFGILYGLNKKLESVSEIE